MSNGRFSWESGKGTHKGIDPATAQTYTDGQMNFTEKRTEFVF